MSLIYHFAATIVELLTNLGDPETAGGAFDQAHAQLRLKVGDLATQLRLGLADCAACGSKATMSNNLGEIVKVVKIIHDIPTAPSG